MARSDTLEPERCAKMLASLASPERLRIVRHLAAGPRCVTEIAAILGVPAANASHHLQVLQAAGLVDGTRRGRFIDYAITPGMLQRVEQAGVSCESLDLGCCQFVLPLERLRSAAPRRSSPSRGSETTRSSRR